MSLREDREKPAYPGWIKLIEEKTKELETFLRGTSNGNVYETQMHREN